MKRMLLAFLVCACAMPAFAWGEKGHAITSEAATLNLPSDMPPFFYRAFPDLIWLGFDPDRWRGGGESIDATAQDHFLDYEYAAGLELPRDRYKFIQAMEAAGRHRRYGIDFSTTGFLPWRIAELTELLTIEFRLWRQAAPGSTERAIIERDIITHAGILGHFAGDAANPHHATFHYNGWVLENPHGYANDCDVHSRFERDFVSQEVDVRDVTPRVAKPVLVTDSFTTAVQFIQSSNALVEPLYRLDRDGHFNPFRPTRSAEGHTFATTRLAAGAALLRDLWWSAWVNSAKPKRRAEG